MTRRLDRTGAMPKPGMIHFGPGNFFRAFNAVYTDEAMANGGGDWGIRAVSLRSTTARDQLGPQGGVFTSVTLGPGGRKAQVITSVIDVLVAPEDPEAAIQAIADPAIKIVSLTITEKGYGHHPATGALDPNHPDIAHDLATPDTPRSAPGFLVAGLARRKHSGVGPITVLSCDNLPGNGALLRRVTLDFARRMDPDLAAWIQSDIPFPATMVDRITPATTENDLAALTEAEGYEDAGCVTHEPFRQWVIEDRFAAGRPAWDLVGAQFVQDVAAHERMKLRCLNGTHSTLAYLGYLAGYETIAETVADPAYASLCTRLWHDEILPTVPAPEGEDPPAYCARLLERYRNPAIRHRTWQIAMDGSQKLPQRILDTVRDGVAAKALPGGLCLAVAGWMRYVAGHDDAGRPIDLRDPLADRLRSAAASGKGPAETVAALLAIEPVFGTDLPAHTGFRQAVTDAYEDLATNGAKATVARFLGRAPIG